METERAERKLVPLVPTLTDECLNLIRPQPRKPQHGACIVIIVEGIAAHFNALTCAALFPKHHAGRLTLEVKIQILCPETI
jgi:hypothetical protein